MAYREFKAKSVDAVDDDISLLQSSNSDNEQAIVRLLLVSIVFVYLLSGFISEGDYIRTSDQVMVVSTVYLSFSILIFFLSRYSIGAPPIRRVLALTMDTMVVTYALIFAGETGAPFVGALLWVPIANGIRYGRNYLYISYTLSLIGFTCALLFSPYWKEEMVLGLGLMFWTILTPIYLFSLLKKLELALESSRQASKSKSQFLANMSHELRTPLNAIIGYGEMLHEDAEANGNTQAACDLSKIQSASNHLLSLINEILDLSKIEAGRMTLNPEVFNIKTLVDDVVSTIQPLADKNSNKFEVIFDIKLAQMKADESRLKQVLINLLSNAAKFTKSGTITLQVEAAQEQAKDVIVFSVHDTGIGMSQVELDSLFQQFMQADDSTSRNYGGTGLGLIISKRICEIMGGCIEVRSEPGEGSTFTIAFPINMGATVSSVGAHEVTAMNVIEARDGSRNDCGIKRKRICTVLVIDDDKDVLNIVSRQLSKGGFNVITVDNGLDGLRIAREHKPDIITLDVMMPGMDGWSVLTMLKKDPELSAIPVVMLTMVDNAAAGYALGAADYLSKPIDAKLLDSVVKKWARHNSREPVLIVDDDQDIRAAISMAVKHCGLDVAEASNGREALEFIARKRPSMIITDIVMPDMNGFEFLEEMKKSAEYSEIPIVAMTGSELNIEEADDIHRSVKEIIMKGEHDLESLVIKINGMLDEYGNSTNY